MTEDCSPTVVSPRLVATAAISVRGLTRRIGGRTILDAITCEIPSGQAVTLIGPSGGGKSTLLRCLNGLNRFCEGEISVGMHRLTSSTSEREAAPVRRVLGMIFQDFQLFPHMTAVQNVMEAPVQVLGLPKEEARVRAFKLLDRVGLADRADFRPQQLSGGQQQRVAIARALAMEPQGLLCDEITSALDPELKHEVLDVLRDLKQDGLTLIVVTHEMIFARKAADRVLLLGDGRILEDGTPTQVFDAPETARARQFFKQVLA